MLERFYAAEREFVSGDSTCGFEAMRDTLADNVALHQSPDLPFGGEYVGPDRYREWAEAMWAIFDVVDVRDAEFFGREDAVVVVCRLVTRSRATGATMDQPMAQVVRVRQGRITEFRPLDVPRQPRRRDGRGLTTRASDNARSTCTSRRAAVPPRRCHRAETRHLSADL